MTKNQDLQSLLEQLLNEAEPVERPTSMDDFTPSESEKPKSLDQAIDRYFVQYEREAIPTSEVYESSNVNNLMSFLFEQDLGADAPDEEPAPDAGGDAGGLPLGADLGGGGGLDLGGGGGDLGGADAGGDAAGGGGDAAAGGEKPPAVMNTPQINLQDFTRSVARLVNNVQSLIDLQSLILNRAEAYIKNNYNQRTAEEMMSILDDQWDLRPESVETTSNPGPENPESHTAVTGPMGG